MYAVVDCNNFYVSCERLFAPKLANSPVVVLSNNDGCIVSRSDEIKKMGVRMGSPAFEYKDLFREYDVHVFSSNFSLYADISARVMKTISDSAPHCEIYSVDEAFIDFKGFSHVRILDQCKLIKKSIQDAVGIPVSIGIGTTKTLAKAANELAKKDPNYMGICIIEGNESKVDSTLSHIPIGDVWGIGRKLTQLFHNHSIYTALQLKYCNDEWIRKETSNTVVKTVYELRGIQCIAFDQYHVPKKSIVSSRSFGRAVTSLIELKEAVAKYASRVGEKLREEKEYASFITISIMSSRHNKRHEYYYGSDTVRLSSPTQSTPKLIEAAQEVLHKIYKNGILYKKASVHVYDLVPETIEQNNLFTDPQSIQRDKKLMKALDAINHSWGSDTVHFAAQGYKPRWASSSLMRSARYTTSWKDLLTVSI